MKKFAFANLRKHTQTIRSNIAKVFNENRESISKAFDDFDAYFHDLENQSISLKKNVRLMLACKLLNHVYSGLILAESGLIVDAILCERNALETIAFHWLVCIEENAAEEYLHNDIPRPVEVRKRLETHGVDIEPIRDLYTSGSQATHVGRNGERFQTEWLNSSTGKLFVGGAYLPIDQSKMFEFLPALLYLFQQTPSKSE